MYVVIVGSGRTGSAVAMELANEGHHVVVVDSNEERLKNLGTVFNGQRLRGIEIDKDVLIEAGIKEADLFLALTPDDNTNIMSSKIAKNIFEVKRVIARVCNLDKLKIYRQMGIETICPIQQTEEVIKSKICLTKGTIELIDENMEILEITVKSSNLMSVNEIEKQYKCIVSAIFKNDSFKIAEKNQVIQKGDRFIVTVTCDYKEKLLKDFVI